MEKLLKLPAWTRELQEFYDYPDEIASKQCLTCEKDLPLSLFNLNNQKGLEKTSPRCKPCRIESYQKEADKRKESPREAGYHKHYRAVRILKKRLYYLDYLLKHPCSECGETNIRVLEFHHIDPQTKSYTVSALMSQELSIDKLKTEIEKCLILCSNCHTLKTAEDLNHWKSNILEVEVFTANGIEIQLFPPLPKDYSHELEAARFIEVYRLDEPFRICEVCGNQISKKKPSGQLYSRARYATMRFCGMKCRGVGSRGPRKKLSA